MGREIKQRKRKREKEIAEVGEGVSGKWEKLGEEGKRRKDIKKEII